MRVNFVAAHRPRRALTPLASLASLGERRSSARNLARGGELAHVGHSAPLPTVRLSLQMIQLAVALEEVAFVREPCVKADVM
jgi:hypothetical protein